MGPVITPESRSRIEGLIQKGVDEGAKALVDGRNPQISGYENGNFVRPTLLSDVNPSSEIARTEIFGPGLEHYPRGHDRRRNFTSERWKLREYGMPIHQQRRSSAEVPL